MLVYGDPVERDTAVAKLERVVHAVARARSSCGIARHAARVEALIEAGELGQALADLAHAKRGSDGPDPAADQALALTVELARGVIHSWKVGFDVGEVADPASATPLRALLPEEPLVFKRPEGYAFYALYPEGHLEAARGLPEGRWRVIGIRSIGTSLGALVGAALQAPVLTVRPGGHPFQRTISLAPEWERLLLADPEARYAIVDEGPGLSGSSFGAVADFLEDRGVAPERIHFLPGHAGQLGPHASPRHRQRWARAARPVRSFEDLLIQGADPKLERWIAELVGPIDGPMVDLSGGAWRARFAEESEWPASHVQQERRKYLVSAAGEHWLAKFVGLGREGERKRELAAALHQAGFGPAVAGLAHGFLIQRWLDDAKPFPLAAFDRRTLISRVAAYLNFRASHFPARPEMGASPERLLEMIQRNAELALGDAVRPAVGAWRPKLGSLAERMRPVVTDNRMHAWKWLVLPTGALLKVDAVDHHAAHDLIGCQDIAWDVAGAAIELELSEVETQELRAQTQVDPELLAFCTVAYLAFQMGACAMARDSLGGVPREQERLHQAQRAYAERLAAWLQDPRTRIA